jgi:hypothetical protein
MPSICCIGESGAEPDAICAACIIIGCCIGPPPAPEKDGSRKDWKRSETACASAQSEVHVGGQFLLR